MASGVHTECSEPEAVVASMARVVAKPEALVEFRAWEAQSLRLSQNWRLIAARETVVEFMVGVIAERETVVELTVRAVAEPETFVNLKKTGSKSLRHSWNSFFIYIKKGHEIA